jgi:hypothetical protein
LGSSLRDRRPHSEILPVPGGSQSKVAIEAELAAGRHAIAARHLTQLMAATSDFDEAAYVLGFCEQKRGLNQAAVDAWARVTPGSSFSARAVSDCMSLYSGLARSGEPGDPDRQ